MFLPGSKKGPFEAKPLNCFLGARAARTSATAGLLREKPFLPTLGLRGDGAVLYRASRCASAEVRIRIVSELCDILTQTPGKHGDLRGDGDAHRCYGKSLAGRALVGFAVRQHMRADSISKRAPSMPPNLSDRFSTRSW